MRTRKQIANDELVKLHHKKQAFSKAARLSRQPNLSTGIGHLVTGSFYDCDRGYFERLLQNYWNRLFLGWNPYKKEGRGCWEIWQRPLNKAELNDMEHWVADIDILTPKFISELRRMDAWEYKKDNGRSIVEDMDRAALDYEIGLDKKEDESIKYAVRHNKKLFGKLKGLAQDGFNPLWFFSDKKQGNGQV